MKNIVFMGTPEYAAKILRALAEAKFELAAVFTQPDKPVGRKQILTPSEVKVYAPIPPPSRRSPPALGVAHVREAATTGGDGLREDRKTHV